MKKKKLGKRKILSKPKQRAKGITFCANTACKLSDDCKRSILNYDGNKKDPIRLEHIQHEVTYLKGIDFYPVTECDWNLPMTEIRGLEVDKDGKIHLDWNFLKGIDK